MRADRLIAMIILLQTRGRMSARQLAAELEVSERTIYRDIVALSSAGIPVYAEAGPQGGYALVEGYSTSLTGLSEGETQALFMLSVPEPLQALGVGQELKAAWLKLAAALPASRQAEQERVRLRFYLDHVWWQGGQEPLPHLKTVHQAVWGDRCLRIRYKLFTSEIEHMVEPYALVVKAGEWYLVSARQGRLSALRVASLLEAVILEDNFRRPADFDLATFWKNWCAEQTGWRAAYPVRIRVVPGFIPALVAALGPGVQEAIAQGSSDERGRRTLTVAFESLEAARERILSFGGGVEVLEPYALRRSLIDYAEQVMGVYKPAENNPDLLRAKQLLD